MRVHNVCIYVSYIYIFTYVYKYAHNARGFEDKLRGREEIELAIGRMIKETR